MQVRMTSADGQPGGSRRGVGGTRPHMGVAPMLIIERRNATADGIETGLCFRRERHTRERIILSAREYTLASR
jgi:hypothetical protein